jgi:hypothetical protein
LRILANEMLATRLAARLGIAVPQVEVIVVRPEIIAYTPDLVMQLGLGRKPCAAGKQFGSQFPGHPARMAIHDFLPDEQLRAVWNLLDFLGVLVFDKWTCNTNGRRAIFFREPGDSPPGYTAMMIDFGFCFNAGEWDFPDAPLRGLYARHRVYEGVAAMQAFEPWLGRLEKRITDLSQGFSPKARFAWSRSRNYASGRMMWRRCCARRRRDPCSVARDSSTDES